MSIVINLNKGDKYQIPDFSPSSFRIANFHVSEVGLRILKETLFNTLTPQEENSMTRVA